MDYKNIRSEDKDGICYITINRPKQLNALNAVTISELNQAINQADNDKLVRCIILTGSENKAFVAGADIKEFASFDVASGEALARKGQELLFDVLEKIGTPSIAAINGFALGGGLELAMACHIRIASDKASFSEAFIRNGLIPADGSCWQLPRMIGLGNTLLLQYLGDLVPADKAFQLGLVNEVVEHDKLLDTTMELAKRIAQGPTYSMSLIKYLVQKSLYTNLEDSLKVATVAQNIARGTEDHKEGVRAFLEKRKPNFKGR